jgi:hypothetical protein
LRDKWRRTTTRAHWSQDRGEFGPAAIPLDHFDDMLMSGSTGVRTDVQSIVQPQLSSHEPLSNRPTGFGEDDLIGSDPGCPCGLTWVGSLQSLPMDLSIRTGKRNYTGRSSVATFSFDEKTFSPESVGKSQRFCD